MPTHLFTLEDTFAIKNRGLVIAGVAPDEAKEFPKGLPNIGQVIELRKPDGSLVKTKVTGIEICMNMGVKRAILVANVTKEDVPPGTEIWTLD